MSTTEKNTITNHMNDADQHFTGMEKNIWGQHIVDTSYHFTNTSQKIDVINHTTDTDIHVTLADKTIWDDKVSTIIGGTVTQGATPGVNVTQGLANDYTINVVIPAPSPTVTVEDNLTSTSAANALSANQGRALNVEVAGHTGDTAIHVTAGDKANWNGKQNTLAAGAGINIAGNTISTVNATDANILALF